MPAGRKDEKLEQGVARTLFIVLAGSSNVTLNSISDCKKFSSLDKLLRVTALVLRFVRKLNSMEERDGLVPTDISAEDIFKAEEIWIGDIQVMLTSNAKFGGW